MPEMQTSPQDPPVSVPDRVVNDFSITFCTINGSGSQTANLTILRALCHMGIPVSGKNIFPSNIQGLPTWYTIRANRDGYLGRKEPSEVVVAVNPNTLLKDMEGLQPGGVLFYADDLQLPVQRQDIVIYPMPVKKLAKEADVPSNLRDYIANMVYVGVVAKMLHIDLDEIYKALDFHFKGKQKPVDSNFNVVKAGADWAASNLEKKDPYVVSGWKILRAAGWSMEIRLPRWAPSLGGCSLRRGIPSRLPPPCQSRSTSTFHNCGRIL